MTGSVVTDLRGMVDEDPDLQWTIGKVVSLVATFDIPGTVISPGLSARAVVTADSGVAGIAAVSVQSHSGVYGGSAAPVCVSATVRGQGIIQRADVVWAEIEGYLIPE